MSLQVDGGDVCVTDCGPTCLRRAVLARFCRGLHVDLILGHQLQLADLHPGVLDPLWHLQETDNGQRCKLATFTTADLLKATSRAKTSIRLDAEHDPAGRR